MYRLHWQFGHHSHKSVIGSHSCKTCTHRFQSKLYKCSPAQPNPLRPLKFWTQSTATSLVHAFISCRLDYCNALLYGNADCQLQRLQSVQNAAARLVTGLRRTEHIVPILKSLHCRLPIRQRLTYKLATLVHKCVNGRDPEYLAEFCHPSVDRRPGMRSADSGKLHVPRTQTTFGDRLFAVAGPRTWNNLPDAIRDSSLSFLTFTKLLKSFVCLTAAARAAGDF